MPYFLCGSPSEHQIVLVFSWFAGHMNETEAANLLEDQSPGSFLVRVSSSRAHEGVFVLAVKTSNNGVVQIQIEVSRTLLFDKMLICFLMPVLVFPRQEPVCPRLVPVLSHICTPQNLFPCSSTY